MTLLRAIPGVLVASSLALAQTPAPQQTTRPGDPEAAALLAAARTALGGDAALDAIHSFTADGLSESKLWSASFRMSWVRPDKFVIVSQRMVGASYAGQLYNTSDGFNGDEVIHTEHRPIVNPVTGGIVIGKRPKAPAPDESEGVPESALDANRRRFAAFALAFFGQTFGMGPMDFVATGDREYVSGGDADRLAAELPDGGTMFLFLDAKTHRPVRLTHAPPSLTGPLFGTMAPPDPEKERKKGAARPDEAMSADDTVVEFSDYKCNKGICWPRQFTLSVGGQQVEKVRFSSFDLNAKINPNVFKPTK